MSNSTYKFSTLFAIGLALAGTSAFANSNVPEKWGSLTSQPAITERLPAVGTLSGVHIAIPREYLVFDVSYEDQPPGKPANQGTTSGLDAPIKNFSLLLRLSDLQPRRSPQDEKQWESQKSSYAANFTRWWMSVDVRNSTWPDHGAGWLKTVIGRRLDATASGGDEYADAPDIYGLTRKVSVRLAPAPSYETQHDLMYDKEQNSTLVFCTHMRRNVEPHDVEVVCTQTFYLDDLHAMVDLNYDDIYLKNWKLYQQKIAELLRSFRK